MYHSIADRRAGACVRPRRFAEQMAYLQDVGYQSVHLDAVYDYLVIGGQLPLKPVVITFDDGYRDNVENAHGILDKYGMCGTIFLATGHVGHTNRWNAADGVPQRPLVSWTEVRDYAGGPVFSFQGHTSSHPRLTRLPVDRVRDEMARGKRELEERLGQPCYHFAYPYGDFNQMVQDAVREAGYRTACTTRWGHVRLGANLLCLPRIGVANGDRLSDFKRILGEPLSDSQYYWRRLKARLVGGLRRVPAP